MNKKWKVKDHYFMKAKKENRLARSSYKLEEIDVKFKIIESGNKVLDIGYYPGSWVQYALSRVGKSGLIIGIDIRAVNKELLCHSNIKLFKKNICDIKSLQDIEVNAPLDVVMSDMAPNTVGIKSVDQAKSLSLTESVFNILPKLLKMNGNLIIKFFDSQEIQNFLKNKRKSFLNFKLFRPKATRSRSKEIFLVGKNYSESIYS